MSGVEKLKIKPENASSPRLTRRAERRMAERTPTVHGPPIPLPEVILGYDPRFDRHYKIPVVHYIPNEYIIINKPYVTQISMMVFIVVRKF